MKVNATGTILWNQTYGGVGSDQILQYFRQVTAVTHYLGILTLLEQEVLDIWLIKTDATGNMLWNKTYGGTRDEIRSAILFKIVTLDTRL